MLDGGQDRGVRSFHMDKNSERELSIKMSALGRKGSRARAKSLSAVQRREIARKAAKARWASKSKKKGKP